MTDASATVALPGADAAVAGPFDAPARGERALVFAGGKSHVVFNIDDQLHAIDNDCPHGASALSGGRLEGYVISCPAHGLRFDVRTGRMPGVGDAPALCVKTLAVRYQGGQAYLCPAPHPA